MKINLLVFFFTIIIKSSSSSSSSSTTSSYTKSHHHLKSKIFSKHKGFVIADNNNLLHRDIIHLFDIEARVEKGRIDENLFSKDPSCQHQILPPIPEDGYLKSSSSSSKSIYIFPSPKNRKPLN